MAKRKGGRNVGRTTGARAADRQSSQRELEEERERAFRALTAATTKYAKVVMADPDSNPAMLDGELLLVALETVRRVQEEGIPSGTPKKNR